MRIDEMRSVAMGAVRSQLRKNGFDPVVMDMTQIEAVLGELAMSEPKLIASQWYERASKRQWDLWRRDWRKWKQGQQRDRVTNGQLAGIH